MAGEVEKIVQVADWLASRERREEPGPQRDPAETPLVPVASRVELLYKAAPGSWGFRLNPLALRREVVFPSEEAQVAPGEYVRLWEDFTGELKKLGNLGMVAPALRLITLLPLLRKYTSYMPSATPWEKEEEYRTLPDVSLYDHLKATCAVAACLYSLPRGDLEALHRALSRQDTAVVEKPVALMLRADLSGIQNFIYRITRPEAEAKGAAKRLRGRSFYLSLLADVIADWYIRRLDLPPANILFCGGGRFDLLMPLDAKEKLEGLEKQLQEWLLKSFYGTVGIQIVVQGVCPRDFEDLKDIYAALDDELAQKKRRKFEGFAQGKWKLDEQDFFASQEKFYDACRVCGLEPLPEPGTCEKCEEHKEIGQKLPRASYIAYVYGSTTERLPGKKIDFPEPFGVTVWLVEEKEANSFLSRVKGQPVEVAFYKLNDTDFVRSDVPPNAASGFKFLANEAPIALEELPARPGKEPTEKDEVLDFEDIAAMSKGVELLGVLKADVDYLGLLFGEGIEPRSISRISTFSHSLDLFFSGWLHELCHGMAQEWHRDERTDNPLRGKVEGLFYIVYSGGDDLLIIGPWDQTIDLAQRLYNDFREYTCQNSNITLSAGVLLVKPHFPIQRFAQLVSKRLDSSKMPDKKTMEKNKITVFRETVRWQDGEKGFDRLLDFGKQLAERVDDEIPRTFVHFLLRVHDQHFKDDKQDCMWVPKVHYAAAKRISREVMADPELDLIRNISAMMKHIRIPVSYVSLRTRKE
jgi:CRISPR-associated protein Csm1